MQYLTIEKTRAGYRIRDSITEKAILYYCYTLENAIKQHRAAHGLRGKHFERIYI